MSNSNEIIVKLQNQIAFLENELREACWGSGLCSLHPKFPKGSCSVCNGKSLEQWALQQRDDLKEENLRLKQELNDKKLASH